MKQKKLAQILAAVGFLLGIHNGYIALWQNGEAKPLKVFPYRAEMLPSSDQEALKKGIPISDESSLAQILEDYLS